VFQLPLARRSIQQALLRDIELPLRWKWFAVLVGSVRPDDDVDEVENEVEQDRMMERLWRPSERRSPMTMTMTMAMTASEEGEWRR
jgi:hypothetical protein